MVEDAELVDDALVESVVGGLDEPVDQGGDSQERECVDGAVVSALMERSDLRAR